MQEIVSWIGSHLIVFFGLISYLVSCFWIAGFQRKLKLRLLEIYLIPLGQVIIGCGCAWLMALIEVGFDMERAANMRIYGTIFSLPWFYYVWSRLTHRNAAMVMDMATVSITAGTFIARLNCFRAGCCQGLPIGDFRWPLREAELVFYGVFIALFASKIRKGKTYGQVYPLFMITYGILRFISEFVREEFTTQVGMLHLAHIWSIISIVAGAVWYIQVRKRNQSAKSR
jgi:hypothetical protein